MKNGAIVLNRTHSLRGILTEGAVVIMVILFRSRMMGRRLEAKGGTEIASKPNSIPP